LRFITARHERAPRLAGLQPGADDFLITPIDEQGLLVRDHLLLRDRALTWISMPPRP